MDAEDPLEGSSGLFESVLSGITDEQWEEYKKQRKMEGEFVVDCASDNSNAVESHIDESYPFDEEILAEVQILHEDEDVPDDEEYDDDDSSNYEIHDDDIEELEHHRAVMGEVMDIEDEGFSDEDSGSPKFISRMGSSWDSDAAVRFVRGDISFSELADIMENSKPASRKRKADGELKDCDISCDAEDPKKQKTKKPRRKMCELPKELEGLMGVANLSFAKGNAEEAIKICLELIRQAPLAQQPYQTLGMIYEETGDMKQSLQCLLLAAYLNPSDTEEWIRLAVISMEQSQIQQAIRCYTFAIRNEPDNINFLWERCNLYEMLSDRKNALAGYEQILQTLNRPEDGQKCVEISREVAKVHHENEDLVNAIKVLEAAFSKFPSLITSEDVNLLLELQISKKCYRAALKNFIQHCGVTVYLGEKETLVDSHSEIDSFTDEQLKDICRCKVPNVLPIDLQVKLLVCLIHLQALKSIHELLNSLMQENADDMGDLYLDVAEAFMHIEEYSSAIPLLSALIVSEKYNLAAVWLKYGDSLNKLSRGKEATEAYNTVLKMAPSYQEARISLSRILIENGKKLEAANALKQEYEEGKKDAAVDLHVLVERCQHLYDLEEYEDFIKAARLAQYSHCFPLKSNEEFMHVLNNQSYKRRAEVLRDLPSIVNKHKPLFHNINVSMDIMWSIFQKLCQKLHELKRFKDLQHLCLESLSSNLWRKSKEMAQDVDLLALLSCVYNQNHKYSYILIKDTIFKKLHNNRIWNLLCLNVTHSQQVRHNRFCLRLLIKNQDHVALGLFNGHCAMNSGSYKHALGLYMSLLRKRPDDPILLFFIGITYTHMASQKFATKRFLLVAQALAFLHKYTELRNSNQEALYNMGRAFHQLGIKDAAVIYYKKALSAPPVTQEEGDLETFDLRHEIVHNLALIYRSSGSTELASTYLRTYNVV